MTDLVFDVRTCLWVVGAIFAFTFTRYIVISGLYYLIAYRWLREQLAPRKLDKRYPDGPTMLAELELGTLNLVNFCGFGVLILWLYTHGYTQLYFEVETYGWGYLLLSIAATFVIQDAYFYWSHRLLHTKPLMRHAHGAHHRFRNPTPFAAFAVHPVEGFLEVGFRPLIVCLLPLHPYAIAALVTSSFVINAVGHGGVELFRQGWSRHPVLGLFSSATHHYVHHKYVQANYALYFTWWDKLMGTEHPKFHEEFDAAAFPAPAPRPAPAPAPMPAPAFASGSGFREAYRGSCSGRMGLAG